MKHNEKAKIYDNLIREGDKVQGQISKLKNDNLFNSEKIKPELNKLNEKLKDIQLRINKLFN